MSIRLTRKPVKGDAVLGDLQTKKVVYATHDSIIASTLDTTKYEYIGFVIK